MGLFGVVGSRRYWGLIGPSVDAHWAYSSISSHTAGMMTGQTVHRHMWLAILVQPGTLYVLTWCKERYTFYLEVLAAVRC